MNNNYSVGNIQPEWNDGMAQTLTFIVTEDCNFNRTSISEYRKY